MHTVHYRSLPKNLSRGPPQASCLHPRAASVMRQLLWSLPPSWKAPQLWGDRQTGLRDMVSRLREPQPQALPGLLPPPWSLTLHPVLGSSQVLTNIQLAPRQSGSAPPGPHWGKGTVLGSHSCPFEVPHHHAPAAWACYACGCVRRPPSPTILGVAGWKKVDVPGGPGIYTLSGRQHQPPPHWGEVWVMGPLPVWAARPMRCLAWQGLWAWPSRQVSLPPAQRVATELPCCPPLEHPLQ